MFVQKNLNLPRRATSAVLHTRAWTTGKPEYNENNHPIPQGSIVGVHNGWVSNAEDLWGLAVARNRQLAEVDSEVIFAMIAHGLEDSSITVPEALALIEGPAAVAWLDTEYPDHLMLARAYANPLHVAQTAGGSVVFASTEEAVIAGCRTAGLTIDKLRDIEEGNLLTVINGDITDVATFEPQPAKRGRKSWGSAYSWQDDAYEMYNPSTGVTSGGRPAKGSRLAQAVEAFEETVYVPYQNWIDRELFDPKFQPDLAEDVDGYYSIYEGGRESEIDSWFNNFRGTGEVCMENAERMHAFVRPGDDCEAVVGKDVLEGQVVAVPNSFPGGKFLLRLVLPKVGTAPAEVILVERGWWQFKSESAGHRAGTPVRISA